MMAVFHAHTVRTSGVGACFRRKTGEVTRIMDRGTASIQNILSTGAGFLPSVPLVWEHTVDQPSITTC